MGTHRAAGWWGGWSGKGLDDGENVVNMRKKISASLPSLLFGCF